MAMTALFGCAAGKGIVPVPGSKGCDQNAYDWASSMMSLSEYTLGPDLRHWQQVPRAFYITSESDMTPNKCLIHFESLISQPIHR